MGLERWDENNIENEHNIENENLSNDIGSLFLICFSET